MVLKTRKYICPMHKDVFSYRPGFCPKCKGMELVPAKLGNQPGNESHDHTSGHQGMAEAFKKRFFTLLPLTFFVLFFSSEVQEWFGFYVTFPYQEWVIFFLGMAISLYGGWPFFTASLKELRSKNWGMMTLVSLAIFAGFLFSLLATFVFGVKPLWWEISTLVTVFLFGHWLEMRAVMGTGEALKELTKLIPPTANKLVGKEVRRVETAMLEKEDRVLIRPGEKIPIDGVVLKGRSTVNESLLTGESRPVFKKKGDWVIGGSINNEGSLIVVVKKTGKETALAQIAELVRSAQETKPRIQNIADKAANYLTLIAIIIGGGTFFYWFFVNPKGIVFALTLSITVIVITCPHALGLAIPTVTTLVTSIAAKNGILIRDMNGLEIARNLDYIVFDKTGTLTEGIFNVSKILSLSDSSPSDILRLAASVEVQSGHPAAQGIVSLAKKKGLRLFPVDKFRSFAGEGVEGEISKKKVLVCNLKMLKRKGVNLEVLETETSKVPKDTTKTTVFVAKNGVLLGAILLEDKIRRESKEAIRTLHKMGIKTAMLTGDKKEVAFKVGKELGIDKVFFEVSPKNKVKKIKELQKKGLKVGMVGDGVNDAPSLIQAHLGIAIGAGTDVAIESAEIILVKNNPLDVVKVLKISRVMYEKMVQNLFWAIGYNVVFIPLAAGVLYPFLTLRPEYSAILMSASSIIVVLNALSLKNLHL